MPSGSSGWFQARSKDWLMSLLGLSAGWRIMCKPRLLAALVQPLTLPSGTSSIVLRPRPCHLLKSFDDGTHTPIGKKFAKISVEPLLVPNRTAEPPEALLSVSCCALPVSEPLSASAVVA